MLSTKISKSCQGFIRLNTRASSILTKDHSKPVEFISVNRIQNQINCYATKPDGFFRKIKKMIGLGVLGKSITKSSGYKLYESITNQVDFQLFLNGLNMPDTFHSWFLVTELHVWMIMVRLMQEGDNGRHVRNAVVEALWQDVEYRSKQLGETAASLRRKQIQALVDEFQACLFSYDEGLLSSDQVLAGALWRNLFEYRTDLDPRHLEKLVEYVRKQICMLDTVHPDVLLLGTENIAWEKL